MLQSLICYGDKTQAILEKLEYNVNNIQLLGCNNIYNLDNVVRKSGALQSIIITESAIDKSRPKLPDIIKENKDTSVIFILNDINLMQQYDIEYYSYSHIYIIDNKNKPMTLIHLKEIISSSKIDDYLLFKGENISLDNNDEQSNSINLDDQDNEQFKENKIEVIEQDNETTAIDLDDNNFIDIQDKPSIQLSLEQDAPIAQTINKESLKSNSRKIRETIAVYNGIIILCLGTSKSYTTTTALNLAKYIAGIDDTVAVIDLDTFYNSSTVVTKKINNSIIFPDSLTKSISTGDMLSNANLIDTNLHLICNSLFTDSLELKKVVEPIKTMILNGKQSYNAIIIDAQLKDLFTLSPLIPSCSKILFNIGMNNKDLLSFMRIVELIEDNNIRSEVFNPTKSNYIMVNPKKNNRLLDTKHTNIEALDSYLQINQIINEEKYAQIPLVGTLLQQKEELDYLGKTTYYNEKEIEKIIMNILKIR